MPFLTERLVAQQSFDDPERIAGLIDDLSSDRFAVRSRAADELEALAGIARPCLEKELAKRPSLDVKRRIDHLLELADAVAVPPVWLRAVRGVEALERGPARRRLARRWRNWPERRKARGWRPRRRSRCGA